MITLWVEGGVEGPSSAGSSLWGRCLPALWHLLPLVLAGLPAMPYLGEALGSERSCENISQGTARSTLAGLRLCQHLALG